VTCSPNSAIEGILRDWQQLHPAHAEIAQICA
jgi:hypothetical protein